jgi:hypothetical protein
MTKLSFKLSFDPNDLINDRIFFSAKRDDDYDSSAVLKLRRDHPLSLVRWDALGLIDNIKLFNSGIAHPSVFWGATPNISGQF